MDGAAVLVRRAHIVGGARERRERRRAKGNGGGGSCVGIAATAARAARTVGRRTSSAVAGGCRAPRRAHAPASRPTACRGGADRAGDRFPCPVVVERARSAEGARPRGGADWILDAAPAVPPRGDARPPPPPLVPRPPHPPPSARPPS